MNKDRVEGAAQNIKGKAKAAAGKALGDEKLRNEESRDKHQEGWVSTLNSLASAL